MKKILLLLCSLGLAGGAALADIVYVTARPSPCTVTANCPGPNTDGTYSEQFPGLTDAGAVGTAPGHPKTTVSRCYYGSADITDPSYGVTLTPTLGVPGGVYQIHYNFNSLAGNTSTNVILSVACTSGGTLSFSETDKFQRRYGSPANQWGFLGYLTNSPGSTTPTIEFRYKSGLVNGGAQNRLLFDCWRFTLYEPCLDVPTVEVVGPLSAAVNEVVVSGVSTQATKVTAYQRVVGANWMQIGSKDTGVTGGNNTVSVSGLVKNAEVSATQTINNQEGCVPAQGILVGGGANPSLRIALTIRETTNETATAGAPGNTSSTSLNFLGATNVSGGAPIDAPIVYPSNGWQTITFSRESETVGNPTNLTAARTNTAPIGYYAQTPVEIQVYAFRTLLPEETKIYSRVAGKASLTTSNDFEGILWSWAEVPGAEGYRVLRSYYGQGFFEGADVTNTFFLDANDYSVWIAGTEVTPSYVQRGPSVQWNPAIAKTNDLAGLWGTLESINFVIDSLDDTGPFDIYIDNISNGTNVFQTFEAAPAGQTDYGFRAPGFSGTTSAHILSAPNASVVNNGVADTGAKSLRVRWQWTNPTASRWLRLTTSGVSPASNPFVNLNEPISFRLLMLPVGAPLPPAPPAPSLSATMVETNAVLEWEGGHRLQTAVDISGPFTNVPQTINPNTYLGPWTWTNAVSDPIRFFRLVD